MTNEELKSLKFLVIHVDTGERYLAMGSDDLSPNFKVYEFASQDGTPVISIDRWCIRKAQAIRDFVGHPCTIGRGFSSIPHNAKIPGASPDSRHLLGDAVDIYPSKEYSHLYTPDKWAIIVEGVVGWDCGLGTYNTHAHYDNHERRRWDG